MSHTPKHEPLIIRIGHDELVIRKRYETASIVNDLLIAAWFIIGSVFFFYASMQELGTWCFLIGSIELMIRPSIRLARHIHLRRVNPRDGAATLVASQESDTQEY